jgi:hypothetical protein
VTLETIEQSGSGYDGQVGDAIGLGTEHLSETELAVEDVALGQEFDAASARPTASDPFR